VSWAGIPALSAALGVLSLTLALGRTGNALWRAHRRRRHWLTGPAGPPPVTAAELYGLAPLLPWLLGTALLGGAVAYTLFVGPARYLGPLAALAPLFWQRARRRAGQRQIRQEVLELLETLRLYGALAPTPGAALALALAEARPGQLWARLRAHREVLALAGPEALLRTVAGEVASPELRRLVSRVRAAQAGNTALARALQAATDELVAEVHRELEEMVEAAPPRLLLPSLVLLLPPALVVVLTPPVQALLDTLAGAGPGLGR